MTRENLWRALAEASQDAEATFATYEQDKTPLNGRACEQRIMTYMERLRPVVGEELAFRLHASYQGLMTALDRKDALIVQLIGVPRLLDDAERSMLTALEDQERAAQSEFTTVRAQISKRLDEVATREVDSDKKGGA